MPASGMAGAVGSAVLLYLLCSGRLSAVAEDGGEDGQRWLLEEAEERKEERRRRREEKKKRKKEFGRWPDRPPATCGEAVAIAARTVRLTYAETLEKWTLGEIAFGIKYHMKQQLSPQFGPFQPVSIRHCDFIADLSQNQGNLQHVYAGSNCIQLKGHEIMTELTHLLRCLNLCMFFSKKPFPVFLEFGGYSKDDVLLQKSKARLLKPSFTIVCNRNSKCFLLFIRGAISFKDRLTAATSAEVPFHHIILHEGKISNLVLGYAHCGMVAAARWIAKCSIPCLDKAVSQFPEYRIKIIGHSMGAGIAAMLTYILRERQKFSSCTCVAFGPAACMTWELAESGKEFITSLVNRTDLVPTFSKVSADNLRSEIMVSPWLNDLRDQIQQTRFLNIVNRYVTFMRSHIPFISSPRSKVVDADIAAPHVSSSFEAVMKQTEDVAEAAANSTSGFSCWSCIGARHRAVCSMINSSPDYLSGPTITSERKTNGVEVNRVNCEAANPELFSGCSKGSNHQESAAEGDDDIPAVNHVCPPSSAEEMGEYKLLPGFEKDLHQHEEDKEAAVLKEVGEEGALFLNKESSENEQQSSSDGQKSRQFYPPGRIMHMVALPTLEANSSEDGAANEIIGIYETPRELYSKIRLARTMIREHYMPKYIQMIELLIDKLGKDDGGCHV